MAIVVLGAHGQLGQEFVRHLDGDVIALARRTADLIQPQQLRRTLEAIRPTSVFNCAAFTHVDKAEADPQQAFAINADGVRDLALICRDLDCTLIHFSTNYVFGSDTERATPYRETDRPDPINVYGQSKLAGEWHVRTICPKHFVIRTCGLYGLAGRGTQRSNFVETILRKSSEGKAIRLVHDQICTPTAALDLVQASKQLVQERCHGLYHLTNSGACSWYEFAQTIVRLTESSVPLIPIRSEKYQALAKRPLYSVLSNTVHPLRSWREALKEYLYQRSICHRP